MYLPQMLPLLRGWDYRVVDFDSEDGLAAPIELKPGSVHRLSEVSERGWLMSVAVAITTFYGKLAIRADGDRVKIDTSPYFLALGGYYAPSPAGYYLTHMAQMPYTGRKTVATPATPEVLGTATLMPSGATLSIQALPGNTGNVYVSYAQLGALAAAARKTLRPGEAMDLKTQNLDRVWLAVDVAAEGVEYTFDGPDVLNNTTSVFAMNFQPAYPLAYDRFGSVTLENPSQLPRSVGGLNTQTLRIISFQTVYVRITNLTEFRRSLQEVLGVAVPAELAGVRR